MLIPYFSGLGVLYSKNIFRLQYVYAYANANSTERNKSMVLHHQNSHYKGAIQEHKNVGSIVELTRGFVFALDRYWEKTLNTSRRMGTPMASHERRGKSAEACTLGRKFR